MHGWTASLRSRDAAPCRWAPTLLLVLIGCTSLPARAGDAVETSGDVLRFGIPLAAYLYTFKRNDADGRKDFYWSFGTRTVITYALKELIDKERPDGSDERAFPSGHTSAAFSGAAFLHRRYGLDKAWPAYALAAYTGWTRIDADKHDEVDVLAGAAIGMATAYLFVDRLENVDVAVRLDGQVGLQFSGRFD